jgi:hypothetical protein
MIKAVIVAVIILVYSNSYASDWSKVDTALQITYSALHVIDWGQTLDIAKHPKDWSETNPILGKHPSISKVNSYFAATLVGHAVVSYLLPKPYRRIWQCMWIGIEAGYVTHNYSVGINVRF